MSYLFAQVPKPGRLRFMAGIVTLLSATLAPNPLRAGIVTIGSPIVSGGYTFTNFDFSPLSGAATGSNVNGINNSGQVVGATVDANGAPTFTNFSGLLGSLTALNTGTGEIAFGINNAGNVVGGNGTNAFFLPRGGSLQNLTPGSEINAFGINDTGNIVGQFTSGDEYAGFILGSSTSSTFTTINQPRVLCRTSSTPKGLITTGWWWASISVTMARSTVLPTRCRPRQA